MASPTARSSFVFTFVTSVILGSLRKLLNELLLRHIRMPCLICPDKLTLEALLQSRTRGLRVISCVSCISWIVLLQAKNGSTNNTNYTKRVARRLQTLGSKVAHKTLVQVAVL